MALGWRGQYTRYREFFLNVATFYKQRADLRAFLEIILSLSTVIIFLMFALKPTVLTIISLVKEIDEKKATVAALDVKIRNLNTASNVFTQNQNSIPNINIAVGTTPQPNLILQQIEGLSVKNSVNILGASVGQVTIKGTVPPKKSSSDVKPLSGGAKEMPVSLSVRGDYANLLSFLSDLENLRSVIKIDTITINSSSTDTGQVIIAVIAGRVPYLGK